MIKFGTGGWREIIADGFTKKNLQLLMLAIAKKMKKEQVEDKGFCIGYDRRFLSKESAVWAAEVIAAEGIHVYFIKRAAPTPLIMFTVAHYNLDYGIAVTASHNPAIYNGIKLFTKEGKDADEQVTEDLEKICQKINSEDVKTIPYNQGVLEGLIEEINPQNDYIDVIISNINMEAIRSKNFHIILDPMYGVSKTSLQTILLTARCDLDVIHERHDTLFGGKLPAPNVDTLDALRSFVIENAADIGIATDGDADRIGVIDDRGQFVHPNEIIMVLYYYLLKYKNWKGAAVRNIATTHIVDKIAKDFGEKCYEVPVGFKHISSAMKKYDAVIGGESSGGMTVRGHIKGKDGIYAATLLVEMMAVTGKKISQAIKDIYKKYGYAYMEEADWEVESNLKESLFNTLMIEKKLPTFSSPINQISYMDGCKVYFKNGWIIARFSGTEPRIRIFCEMPTKRESRKNINIMANFLGLNTKKISRLNK